MSQSGDPRKQDRPDGRDATVETTKAFPPSLSGVITEFGAEVIPFPIPGGSAIQIQPKLGPMTLHLVLDPAYADQVCTLIQEAKAEAQSGLRPATIGEVNALANGNGAKV